MSIYEIGLLSGFTTMFINYIIGKPSSEFSPYEIFSSYTVWLSKRRLKKVGLLPGYNLQFAESINSARTISERTQIRIDFKRILYQAAEPFFTWERAVGMCPVCTGFWIAIGTGLAFTQNFLDLFIIIVISHITIRLLNKFL